MHTLIFVVAGLLLSAAGWNEYKLQDGSSVEPTSVEVAELEQHNLPENHHLRLGRHWRAWDEVIYEWEGPKELKEPTPTTKVNFAYYPIISESHPYLQRVGEALERYGSWDDIPESERPVFDDFSVLVRSERYKVVRAVPGPDWDQADAVQGLIVNGVRSLGVEERNLLGSSFPTLNLDRVLILEEGRTPSSMTSCLGLLGSGAALLLAALYFVLVKRRASGLAAPPPLVELPGVV